jgi:hypothetical protein
MRGGMLPGRWRGIRWKRCFKAREPYIRGYPNPQRRWVVVVVVVVVVAVVVVVVVVCGRRERVVDLCSIRSLVDLDQSFNHHHPPRCNTNRLRRGRGGD